MVSVRILWTGNSRRAPLADGPCTAISSVALSDPATNISAGGFIMQEETETQKAIWTPPHATHIDLERTLSVTASFAGSLDGDEPI